ncbi:unnamed protein product, partial [Brassica rapa]
MPHSLEDKLVEEEEDEDVPNIHGIKRKNPIGRSKNQNDGLYSRFKARAKKKLLFQESTPTSDTQLSLTTTGLHNEPFFSQVSQEPTLFHGTQLDIDATNPTLPSGSFFSQLLQDFDKNYGDQRTSTRIMAM